MIKYEAYNQTTKVQFLNEQDAIAYAQSNDMEVREISEENVVILEPSKEDWLKLEQSLYANLSIFGKALNSTGNGFAFLSKVFADGKTFHASENALAYAIQLTASTMTVPYTQEEIDFINQKLQENNFNITI